MTFTVTVLDSAVEIDLEASSMPMEELDELYIKAFDIARACVDVLAFAKGWGLSVYLDTFVSDSGVERPLLFGDPSLAKICTAYDVDIATLEGQTQVYEMMKVVMGDPPLFMALNDLIQTNLPHQAATNCGRVIDGLRMIIAPDLDPKQGWTKLRQTLHIDFEYLNFISKRSVGPRHGHRFYLPAQVTQKLIHRTWNVMNRFLEFRSRGSEQLSLSDFPLLKD